MAKTNYKLKVKLPNGTVQSADIYDSKEDMNAYKGKKRYINVKCPNGKQGYVQACLYAEGHREYTKAWVKFPDGVQGALGNPMPNVPAGYALIMGDKKHFFTVPKGVKVIDVLPYDNTICYVGVTPGKKYVFEHFFDCNAEETYFDWVYRFAIASIEGKSNNKWVYIRNESDFGDGCGNQDTTPDYPLGYGQVSIAYSPEINKHKVDVTCY